MIPDLEPDRRQEDGDINEYKFAGMLIGTDWVFPEDTVRQVKRIRQVETSMEGVTMFYPEAVLSNNRSHRVSELYRKINPKDLGELEPANHEAKSILAKIRKHHRESE